MSSRSPPGKDEAAASEDGEQVAPGASKRVGAVWTAPEGALVGFQGHSEVRFDRGFLISWGGIVAGTVPGWAVFSLLSLLGAAIGLAKFDPYSANPANGLGAGSGIFGVIALLVSSFLSAYLAVRIAGDRRRSKALLMQKRKPEDLHEPPSTPARHDETIIVPPGA